jgi:hypothetical protein
MSINFLWWLEPPDETTKEKKEFLFLRRSKQRREKYISKLQEPETQTKEKMKSAIYIEQAKNLKGSDRGRATSYAQRGQIFRNRPV